MGSHAKLSPSSASRWMACPGSANASIGLVDPDTEHSIAGTARHEVAAIWLRSGEAPALGSPLTGEDLPAGLVITPEMLADVRPGVEWALAYINKARAEGPVMILIEERTEVGACFGLPPGDCYGTCDLAVFTKDEVLIQDHKYGYQTVAVVRNVQLLLYALGMMEEMGWMWPRIRLSIDQPKGEGVSEWVITKEELLRLREEFLPKVQAANVVGAPLVYGEEQCRYCPAAGTCKTLQAQTLALAQSEFATPAALIERISLDDLSTLLQKADLIEAALKAAREHGRKLALSGQPVPGFKLVRSNKHRTWKPGVKQALLENAEMLGYDLDDIAPREVISPAAMEKKGLKQLSEAYAMKPEGEPVLAPADDKRAEYKPFEDSTETMKLLE